MATEKFWDEYKSLLNTFDFYYTYSDDHGHWKKHSAISRKINELYATLSKEDRSLADAIYKEEMKKAEKGPPR